MIDTSKKLYFVDVDERQNVMLALDVQFIEEDGRKGVGFYDTNRGRMFFGEITILESEQFKIETENNKVMVFRLATISEYDLHWRSGIEGSVPVFRTDNELHHWYYKQFC